MTDFDQPEVQVSDYGRARREAWLNQLRANQEAMSQAAVAAHQQDHDVITAGQRGIMGMSGQEQAAAVAGRQVTVGTGTDAGRPLERNGGVYQHHVIGPAPVRRDLRYVDQVEPPGERMSPLLRHMRGEQ